MPDSPRVAPFSDLHLLTLLAQTQSFTAAARRAGLSKATMSLRIAELERTLAVPLVRRTTRSVVLTDAGLKLVQDTEPAFASIEQSLAGARDSAGAARGLVRITAPVALGRQHLAPLLPPFLRAHPQVRLELDLDDRLVNLAQQGFDLAVRHVQSVPETHVAWTLCETRTLLVASPDYLQRHGTPLQPDALAGHACLSYLRTGATARWVFERGRPRRAAERVQVLVSGPLRVNNSEVLRDNVLAGAGIALLPDFTAAQHVASGALEVLLPAWRPVGFFGERLYAMRPWSAQVPRAVQLLVQHLRDGLAGGFPLQPS